MLESCLIVERIRFQALKLEKKAMMAIILHSPLSITWKKESFALWQIMKHHSLWGCHCKRRGSKGRCICVQVEKALTVTQNKLGDLLYRTGNLERARDQYQKALAARQGIAAASEGDEKWVAELDVAFSFAKLADIEQVQHI